MDFDLIKELGYKSLDSRFKRISDRMAHDVRKFYKELGIDIEPNWYLVFLLLQKEGEIPITAIAGPLGYTHPSVAIMVKKMAGKGYLRVRKDRKDKRKQMVALTGKTLKILPQLEVIWQSCEQAIFNLLAGDLAILKYLDNIDEELKSKSFHDRFQQEYLKSKAI